MRVLIKERLEADFALAAIAEILGLETSGELVYLFKELEAIWRRVNGD